MRFDHFISRPFAELMTPMFSRWHGIVCACLLFSLGVGCKTSMHYPNVPPGTPVAEMPFELIYGHIIIPVRVNDSEPKDFVVDTGSSTPIVNEGLAELLKMDISSDTDRARCWNGWVDIRGVFDATFDVAGLKHSPWLVAAAPLGTLDGILGHDMFKRYVIEINFETQRLRLFNPKHYPYSGNGKILPLKLHHWVPYTYATLFSTNNVPVRAKFLVDTGDPSVLSMEESYATKHHLTSPTNRVYRSAKSDLVGQFNVKYDHISKFQLGPYIFKNPSCTLLNHPMVSDNDSGVIGLGALERFKVIFDYPRHRMILEPNTSFHKPFDVKWQGELLQTSHEGFRLWMSGAQLVSTPPLFKEFRVNKIKSNSPADLAGLHLDDVIVSLDGRPLSEYSLDQWAHFLEQSGQTYSLTVRRGTELIATQLKLEWLSFWE